MSNIDQLEKIAIKMNKKGFKLFPKCKIAPPILKRMILCATPYIKYCYKKHMKNAFFFVKIKSIH